MPTDERSILAELSQEEANSIDIDGLPKAMVLLALYEHAMSHRETEVLHPKMREIVNKVPRAGRLSVAEAWIDNDNYSFDYLDLGNGSRALKVNLSSSAFNPKYFDEYHGRGQAQKAISTLVEELQTLLKGVEKTVKNKDAELGADLLWLKKAKEEQSSQFRSKPDLPRKRKSCCSL